MEKVKKGYKKSRKFLINKIPILKIDWVSQFIKSQLLGGVGTIINLSVIFLFTEFLGIYYIISGGIGFVLGSTANYFLNKKYVFREEIRNKVFSKYTKYIIVSILALFVSMGMLAVFTEFVKVYYVLSQFIANAIAFSFRFVVNKLYIFRDGKKRQRF